ncbi:MAG: Uma2 family endonuclease [Cyanobacteria bacterium P01_F01_bin.150]
MTCASLQPSVSQPQQSQRVVLNDISWTTYRSLCRDLGTHRLSRLAYDRGVLEIVMPSELHEVINRLLALIVTMLTDELDLKIKGYGSTTLDREDLERGVEPDSCFYIQNVDRILGRQLDISVDPPPDLAIEVDITSSSQRRFGIYRQLQVPEIWRYTQTSGVIIYKFQDGEYVKCEFSPTFPMISGDVLMKSLEKSKTEDDNAIIRALRQWIRKQVD